MLRLLSLLKGFALPTVTASDCDVKLLSFKSCLAESYIHNYCLSVYVLNPTVLPCCHFLNLPYRHLDWRNLHVLRYRPMLNLMNTNTLWTQGQQTRWTLTKVSNKQIFMESASSFGKVHFILVKFYFKVFFKFVKF